MLTEQDIQKIISVVATKEDVHELKEDIAGLRESVQALIIAVDKLVKAVETYHQEQLAITSKVDRLERWIMEIADKIGMELKS